MEAVLSLYISTLLAGFTVGFSAVAGPDMRLEMVTNTSSPLPTISVTEEDLSWFGKTQCWLTIFSVSSSQQCQHWHHGGRPPGRLLRRKVRTQEDHLGLLSPLGPRLGHNLPLAPVGQLDTGQGPLWSVWECQSAQLLSPGSSVQVR